MSRAELGVLPDDTVRLHSILALLPKPRLALEIGCGFYPIDKAYTGEGTCWIALDPDLAALRSAHRCWPQAQLIQADGCFMPLKPGFDLIVIRHPNLDQYPDSWQVILKSAGLLLAPGGILVVTLYSYGERDLIRAWLKNVHLRCEIPPERDLCPPGLPGRDRFVVIGRFSA